MKKSDGRKNANVKKGDVFQMQWTDAAYVPTFLNDLINSFGPGQRVHRSMCEGRLSKSISLLFQNWKAETR